jgi:very-short-patch-repair endonuclease
MGIAIEGIVASKVGFASHQNAVPVLRELAVINDEDHDYEQLTIELTSSLPFLETKHWHVDRLMCGSTMRIVDRDVKLSEGYLADIAESLRAEVLIRVRASEQILATQTYPVELLGRQEWGGVLAMPELLAAFSQPNDPAVDSILKKASDVLRRAGKKDAIDGYSGQSRTRTWELISSIWSAVCNAGVRYALPPASFEMQGQKIRTPSAVLEGGLGTCLDTALLFAAAIEQAGLNPLLVLTQGHAFAGAWLQPQEFSQLITEDAASLRKRIELNEVVVFETTLATQAPAPSFSHAMDHAKRQVTDEAFVMALDLRRARMQRIRPLAVTLSIRHAQAESGDAAPAAIESLEEAPVLPGFDIDIAVEPDTPAGKLQLWQRKLLDLTTRNRLLHVPDSAKAIRLICTDPAALEDQLAEGKRIRIVAMPDLEAGGRDAAVYEQQNQENLREAYARNALKRGEVLVAQEPEKLETSIVEMYRKARSDLDEGGANTLFLAIGFLKWKKAVDDPKSYSAPLILLPVKLERKSATSGVAMAMLDEEPRFNLTLLELLRHDFELNIPGLEGELLSDGSGIDVIGVWNTVRRAVRDMSGFEVTNEVVLGTFSFAKYLMWKDLADRSEQLMQSPLVHHLLERKLGGDGFTSQGEFPRPEQLDALVDPHDLFTPLPADSSQLAAVVASAKGHTFVLDGPPGTGKSQTIANMIAHNLALGRRVLFVAEKMAALDVVKRRLDEKGIGEFCLELHSNKASKVDVLKQLERAWDARDALTAKEWQQEADRVRDLRAKLNGVVGVLHKRWPNGLTVHEAMGRVIRDATAATPRLEWSASTVHSAEQMARLRDVARRLGLNRGTASSAPGPFLALRQLDWSNGWQEALSTAAREVLGAQETCHAAFVRFLDLTRMPVERDDYESIPALLGFARLLPDAHGQNLSFAFSPDVTAKQAAAKKGLGLAKDYAAVESSLSFSYDHDAAQRLDVNDLELRWQAAGQKFWFLATLAKKKVAQSLAVAGGAKGLPDVAADLPKLRQMRELRQAISALDAELKGLPGWAGIETNRAKLSIVIKLADEIRSGLSALAKAPEHLVLLRRAASLLLVDGNDLLSRDGVIAGTVVSLAQSHERMRTAMQRFTELASASNGALSLTEIREAAVSVIEHELLLKPWCDWCRVRDEANAMGLSPITEAITAGGAPDCSVEDLFAVAYARWFAIHVIDDEPLLRGFVPAEHMSDIEAYRQVDDQLARLTSRYIRAKLCGLIPDKNEASKSGGFGILKHELQKSRRHKPVRQLASEMGGAMSKLAPCMLMSPLSIAQYLPADQELFDLVIFDEASQIAPWDAIGSIARGKHVVIAGDPRQMPPTSFFNRGATADDDTEDDLESILDECLGAGVPSHRLTWHYRSRHESLIAFSNHNYYGDELITFPAAETRPSTVEWCRVDGVYAQGKGRNNQIEAKAIVAAALQRLRDPAFIAAGKSLGIITLNSEQQKLVSDLLDQARANHPEIEPYFQLDRSEPVVVKNLETVQGDERDVIILGIGYGPTTADAKVMSMNFGPLNREGGWRRLNVAVTRARQEMLVFTSFDPSMVDLNRTSARAVRDLRHFIEFAQRGPRALGAAIRGSMGSYESPFEAFVADGLRAKGWDVVPQIGVSRFRIDLGVIHPDRPGDYLVGVECDGATYHSAATARDRDKVRSAILQGLGWKLVRVWSTEWWIDRAGALERLHKAIEVYLEASRLADEQQRALRQASSTQPAVVTVDDGATHFSPPASDELAKGDDDSVIAPDWHPQFASLAPVELSRTSSQKYQVGSYQTLVEGLDANQFYDSTYASTLSQLIRCILEHEAPILDTLLVQRVARVHGFQRSGRLIRERVLELVERDHHIQTDIHQGQFVWTHADDIVAWNSYRTPENEEAWRSIEEIALPELRCAARAASGTDVAFEVARIFGVKRVTTQARARIEHAVKSCGQGL